MVPSQIRAIELRRDSGEDVIGRHMINIRVFQEARVMILMVVQGVSRTLRQLIVGILMGEEEVESTSADKQKLLSHL